MGYTHYWKRVEQFNQKAFEKVVFDFKEVMKHLLPFVQIANGSGTGLPEINNEMICFNGVQKCGHDCRDLGITWPDENASGISLAIERYKEIPTKTLITVLCGQEQELAINDSDVAGT